MPRKGSGLDRVVSTKLPAEDFDFLERYARLCYNKNYISQPTVSHVLRMMVTSYKRWILTHNESKQNVSPNQVADSYSSSGSAGITPSPKKWNKDDEDVIKKALDISDITSRGTENGDFGS
jgi:hypothetical protein